MNPHVRNRVNHGLLITVLVSMYLVISPAPVMACSCVALDAESRLATADAAFTGTLVDVAQTQEGGMFNSAAPVPWRFKVDKVVKGQLGAEVSVMSATSGASCGFDIPVGTRAGVLLHRDGESWTGGLCSQMSAEELLKAAGGSTTPPEPIPPVPSQITRPPIGPRPAPPPQDPPPVITLPRVEPAPGFVRSSQPDDEPSPVNVNLPFVLGASLVPAMILAAALYFFFRNRSLRAKNPRT
ncbi:MAG: hypothetical protein ACRDIU_00090 [Actinomycetota bacterium]